MKPQSRYVGYYEIMKSKFNRQLPPPKSLTIKSIRIHSIAGDTQQTSVALQWGTFILYISHRACVHICFLHSYLGVGKGDGSDLKVKIILKKELVFQCVCAKQENCTVSLTRSSGHIDSFVEQAINTSLVFKGVPRCGQQCCSHQPAEWACGWGGREGHVWVKCCECMLLHLFFFLSYVRKAGVLPEPMIQFLFIFLFRVCQKDTKMFRSTSGSIPPS